MAVPIKNHILDRLPPDELDLLLTSSQTVTVRHGEEVFRRNGPMQHVYFPTTGVFGILVLMEEGKRVEGNTVGREGMIGLPLFLGHHNHPYTAAVQLSGEALRVPATRFLQVARPGGSLDRLLRQYALYRMWSAHQTGACNTVHGAEERMVRWLLLAHDRAGNPEFMLTHEFLAELLGVRRQTITSIARDLRNAGLIGYRRGVLRLLNRKGLEKASCECYDAMNEIYSRIMVA